MRRRPLAASERNELSRARGSAAVQRRQPLGFRDVIHRVGVEERIERRGRPGYGGESESRGPAVDLPDVLDDKRVAELFAATEIYAWHSWRRRLGVSRDLAEKAVTEMLEALVARWHAAGATAQPSAAGRAKGPR